MPYKNLLIQRIDYNINDFQINAEDMIIWNAYFEDDFERIHFYIYRAHCKSLQLK